MFVRLQPLLQDHHHPDHHAVIAGMRAALHGQHVVEIRRLDPAALLEIQQVVANIGVERGALHAHMSNDKP
jgi:hypothetical protein